MIRLLASVALVLMPMLPPAAIDVNALPGFVNLYDPKLGGINCQEPCGQTANGLVIEEYHYGRIAACSPSQIGCWVTFSNDYGTHGPYQCNDTGGALLEPRLRDDRLVQYYDVLWDLTSGEPLPWWNHALFEVDVTCYGEDARPVIWED